MGAGPALLSVDDATGRMLTPLAGSAQLRSRLRLCAQGLAQVAVHRG